MHCGGREGGDQVCKLGDVWRIEGEQQPGDQHEGHGHLQVRGRLWAGRRTRARTSGALGRGAASGRLPATSGINVFV